jgi:predicted SAM-dependent methyltransferase
VEISRIIVGAGNTTQDGWRSLEESELDVRDYVAWCGHFIPANLEAILAEHVLEHLTMPDAAVAVRNCYSFLKRGGYVRLAVPDGFHPNQRYIDWVRPHGIWTPEEHKTLFNYHTLCALLEGAGFKVRLLEWWDESGELHQAEWQHEHGRIARCCNSLYSQLILSPVVGARFTSLVVDGFKV